MARWTSFYLLNPSCELGVLVRDVHREQARGTLPRDIQDVMARHKDILYSSRTRYNTDVYRRVHRLKTRLYEALMKIPEDRLSDEERRLKTEEKMPEITILHIIYQHAKDYEFSGTSA